MKEGDGFWQRKWLIIHSSFSSERIMERDALNCCIWDSWTALTPKAVFLFLLAKLLSDMVQFESNRKQWSSKLPLTTFSLCLTSLSLSFCLSLKILFCFKILQLPLFGVLGCFKYKYIYIYHKNFRGHFLNSNRISCFLSLAANSCLASLWGFSISKGFKIKQ